MDLSPIVGKLDVVRRRARTLILVDGVSRVVMIALALALFTFVVDYFVPKVPVQVRFTLLVASLGAIALSTWRYILSPINIRLTDDDLALVIEKQYPDLQDRLISAIQLSREGDRYARFNSPELVDTLVVEALRESKGLDFNPVVLPGGPMKLAAWAALTVAALGGVGFWQRDIVKIWAARLFSDSVQWPKKTRIVVLNPQGNPVTVAKGDDLQVEIETKGVTPRKAAISYRFSNAGEAMTRPMRAEQGGRWRFEFSKVIEPIEFWIEAGDDETEPVKVAVLNPPAVDRIAALYEFPAYTGMKNTDPLAPVEDGNIVAPIGTKVHIMAQTNLDIAKAKIMFGRRGEDEVRDIEVRSNGAGQPREVRADIEVLSNTQYAIWLQATNGLQTGSPVRYSIKATADKAPEIKVSEPGVDKFCTPQARIPIRLTTTDDFGVAALVMVVKTNDTKKPETTIPLDAFNTESYPSKRIDTEYWFDMTEFGGKEGMVIQYQIVARDGRVIPEPNETKSRVFQLTVIKRDDMLKRLEDMLARLREELRRVIAFQEAGRADAARLMDALGDKDNLETMERQSVNSSAANQRRITQHLERIQHEFEEIVRDMRYNKLIEGSGEGRLKKPADLLKEVTEVKSPEAANMLTQAASVIQGKDRQSKLQDTAVKQDEILTDLNTILGLLTEYETYMEVVRYVREMLRKATDNLNDMRKLDTGGGK